MRTPLAAGVGCLKHTIPSQEMFSNKFSITVDSFDLLQSFQILSLIHPSKTGGFVEIWKNNDLLYVKRYVTDKSNETIDIACQGVFDYKITGHWLSIPDLARNLKFGTTEISGDYESQYVKFNDYIFRSSIKKKSSIQNDDLFQSCIVEIDAENTSNPPACIEELSLRYERNPKLVSLLKSVRGSKCQICGLSFKDKNGEDYSEAHHLEYLSKDGLDVSKNILILCANHHRQFHYGDVTIIKHDSKSVSVSLDGTLYECSL